MLAKQAAGACLVQYTETVVLTAVASGPPRPGVTDFFPLTCDYRERTRGGRQISRRLFEA